MSARRRLRKHLRRQRSLSPFQPNPRRLCLPNRLLKRQHRFPSRLSEISSSLKSLQSLNGLSLSKDSKNPHQT